MTRYADGPTTGVEVDVAAPAADIWPLVVDIDLPRRFSREFQGAEWIDGATGPAPGARFRGRNRHPAIGEWTTTCTVVACDPPRHFAWAVEDPDDPVAVWHFELTPHGATTGVRMWARMGPGPSGLTPAIEARPDKEERIVERRLEEWRSNMVATLEGIRDLAEGSTSG